MKKAIINAFRDLFVEKYGSLKVHDNIGYYTSVMAEQAVHKGLVEDAKESIAGHGDNPLLSLMHDTANDLDTIRWRGEQLRGVFKQIMNTGYIDNETSQKLYVFLEYITQAGKSIMDDLDTYYVRRKEIESNIKKE